MKKRGRFLIVLLLVLISLISVVYAASKTYNYKDINNNPLTNAQSYIYGCTNSNCVSLNISYWNSPTSTTTSSITINGNPSLYNKEFNYINCYEVDEEVMIYNDYDGNSMGRQLKKVSCSSTPSNLQITGIRQTNNALTITANLKEVFSSQVASLPTEVKYFYDAETRVQLYINNQLINNKTVTVPEGNTTTSFTWIPTSAGDYDIKITTDVTDCKCSSSSNLETTASITINPTSTQTCTSSDWSYTVWSPCINSQQNRTVTKTTSCIGETGKPVPTQPCYQCSDGADNDGDGKIDYSSDPGCSSATDNNETDLNECNQAGQNCPPDSDAKCPTGHPKCSCTGDLKKYLCSSNQVCQGTSLINNDPGTGTCCSVPCTTSQTNQNPPPQTECTSNEEALCLPDSQGCAQKKTCTLASTWSPCYKINQTCMATQDCVTTTSGTCSQAFPGTLCINGQLIQSPLCQTSTNTTATTQSGSCLEIWNCVSGWTDCNNNDYHTCIKWEDLGKCGTTYNKPSDYQKCSYTQTPAYGQYQTYLQTQSFKGSESDAGRILVYGQAGEGTSVQNLFNALIPRGYSLKLGLDTSLALLIIAIFISSVFFYYMAKYKHPIKEVKEKLKAPQAKEPLKPVKINDLMLNVIESLEGDEKRIAQKLIEGEGIRISKLREILSMNKTKMEIALSKLERRQIIKERTDDDSKLYFNDWLK